VTIQAAVRRRQCCAVYLAWRRAVLRVQGWQHSRRVQRQFRRLRAVALQLQLAWRRRLARDRLARARRGHEEALRARENSDGAQLQRMITEVDEIDTWSPPWEAEGYRSAAEIADSATRLPWRTLHAAKTVKQLHGGRVTLTPLGEQPTPRRGLPPLNPRTAVR
jgi:hypothetical protein